MSFSRHLINKKLYGIKKSPFPHSLKEDGNGQHIMIMVINPHRIALAQRTPQEGPDVHSLIEVNT